MDHLSSLLRSKSWKVQLLGLTAILFLFVPKIADIAENPELSIWQRVAKVSQACGELLGAVAIAAIDPKSIADSQNMQ